MYFYLINNFSNIPENTNIILNDVFCTCLRENYSSYNFIMDKDNFNSVNIVSDNGYVSIRYNIQVAPHTLFSYSKTGFKSAFFRNVRLFISKEQINNSIFTEMESDYIFGKYYIKNCNNQYTNLKYITLPIKFTLNNVEYNYIYTGGEYYKSNFYSYSYSGNGFQIKAFSNTYLVDKSIENPNDSITLINSNGTTLYNNYIIDFGETPQEVPKEFANFINSNFEKVYTNSYTIMSYDGAKTLFSSSGKPPITNESLYVYGNPKILEVTYENSTTEQFSFSDSPPESNMQFVGLSLQPNSKTAVIPIGENIGYNVSQSTVFYEAYNLYKPPATTFDINLYKNIAENNRVDKTNYITSVGVLQGSLREECSITDPSIIIQSDSLPNFNYVYIPIWNRYYYVNEITSVRYGLWRISLHVDVLMTYKLDILNLNAIIGRQEYKYNRYIVDRNLPISNLPNINVIPLEIDFPPFNTSEESTFNYLLTVVS